MSIFNYFTNQTPQRIISDKDIKGKNVQEINQLKSSPENKFSLTNIGLHDAYQENDINIMTYLNQQFNLRLPGYGNYHIDVAIETGNTDMSKFLVNNFNSKPSLYAVQMGKINGHHELVDWVNQFSEQRNAPGINVVHSRYDKQKGAFVWDSY